MSLALLQSDYFLTDLRKQVDWYQKHATPEVAERYVDAVEATVRKLADTPGLGRVRFPGWPELAGIRSLCAQRPYHRHLIFYRFDEQNLLAERVIHGARDLPRRLLLSPYANDD